MADVRRDFGDRLAARNWRDLARPAQVPPAGDWRCWLLLGGRGSGKTRSASEHVTAEIASGRARSVAAVGRTAADVRDVMTEGPSGLVACAAEWMRPTYESSKRRISYPNGAIVTTFAAEEPDSLRGPQHDLAWVDELATFERPEEVWANLMLGLRLGQARCVVSTTPRPIPIIVSLVARDGQDVRVSRMSTYDNLPNLSPAFARDIIARFQGTYRGRQELEAELLLDAPGALWSRELLERTRVPQAPATTFRAVGVDPSVSGDVEGASECGIVAVGVDGREPPHGYVLADLSLRAPPWKWAEQVMQAARDWSVNAIVAESNQGGELVRSVLMTVAPAVPVTLVSAHESKAARAEPISSLFEQGRCHIVGAMPELEQQLCGWVPGGESPDRLDAMTWAFHACRRLVPSLDEPPYVPPAASSLRPTDPGGLLSGQGYRQSGQYGNPSAPPGWSPAPGLENIFVRERPARASGWTRTRRR